LLFTSFCFDGKRAHQRIHGLYGEPGIRHQVAYVIIGEAVGVLGMVPIEVHGHARRVALALPIPETFDNVLIDHRLKRRVESVEVMCHGGHELAEEDACPR